MRSKQKKRKELKNGIRSHGHAFLLFIGTNKTWHVGTFQTTTNTLTILTLFSYLLIYINLSTDIDQISLYDVVIFLSQNKNRFFTPSVSKYYRRN